MTISARALLPAMRAFATGVVLALCVPASAQGDLLIAPTRVVFSGGGSTEVILANIGTRPATYRISLELRRMGGDGTLHDIAEADATPAERAALDMIRYAPRRIALEPNQPQSIRINARPPAELPNGEYRVHMSFRAIPEVKPVDAAPAADATGLSIRLTPIYGITIPVIIRKGQLDGGATIANPSVLHQGKASSLRLDLRRSGNRSIYGEIRVIAKSGGEPILLARGIAIYPEIESRTLELPLSPEQAVRMKGPLRFEYRELSENGGKLFAAIDATVG